MLMEIRVLVLLALAPQAVIRKQRIPPPTKRSRFSHLSKLLEKKVKEGLKQASKQPPGGLQLEQYLENVHTYPDDKDPL